MFNVSRCYEVEYKDDQTENYQDSAFSPENIYYKFKDKEMNIDKVVTEIKKLGSFHNYQKLLANQKLYANESVTDSKTGARIIESIEIAALDKDDPKELHNELVKNKFVLDKKYFSKILDSQQNPSFGDNIQASSLYTVLFLALGAFVFYKIRQKKVEKSLVQETYNQTPAAVAGVRG